MGKSLFAFFLFLGLPLFADSTYVPPFSAELYEKSPQKPFVPLKDRLLLGGELTSGQSRSSGRTPITAYSYGVNGGYRKIVDTWSFYEAGLGLSSGKMGHSEASLDVDFQLIASLGYGSSISKGVYGIWSFGAGIAQAGFENTTEEGVELQSNHPLLGSVIQGGYRLHASIDDASEMFAGLRMGHALFHLNSAKTSQGETLHLNEAVSCNLIEISLGVRAML